MYAFALGELGLSSLDKVYRMSWREFQLRLHSYKRQQKNRLQEYKLLARFAGYQWNAKTPDKLDSIFGSDEKQSKELSESQKEMMIKAVNLARAKTK